MSYRYFTKETASAAAAKVPKEKRTFFKDREKARVAGAKGGAAVAPQDRSFSKDRQLAMKAGRAGGQACARARVAKVFYNTHGRIDD